MKRGYTGAGSLPSTPTSNTAIDVTPSSVSLPIASSGGRPIKIQRRGSRLVSALRYLTNNAVNGRDSETWPSPSQAPASPTGVSRQVTQKLSLPGLTRALSTSRTVIHRYRLKPKLSFRLVENESLSRPSQDDSADAVIVSTAKARSLSRSDESTIVVTSTSSSSALIVGMGETTTPPTSVDSKISSNDHALSEKRPAPIIHAPSPKLDVLRVPLGTIQETPQDLCTASIVTVERAAASKIYLESYYNELFTRLTPRTLRHQSLEMELRHTPGLTREDKELQHQIFFRAESDYLRRLRTLKAYTAGALQGRHQRLVKNYEVLKILGKGSFGVVRLVRYKHDPMQTRSYIDTPQRVYAMKVIRKSKMLRSNQEGHLRAERDFLVASEGSKWIVRLMASFEDLKSLYLVMEYMPGGDFLGLLIRENILSEPTTKFYIAEMVLCIEQAHALGCIHRDVKPENFLISSSGHLKISDFGLAFDGHWSHESNYYHAHRYSLLHKLGIQVDGDAQDRDERAKNEGKGVHVFTAAMQKHDWHNKLHKDGNCSTGQHREPVLSWRNRCGNRSAAKSCVGTSQYMAPEVIREEDGGRQATKHNIVYHKQTLTFPTLPIISRSGHDLMTRFMCDQEERLSSPKYRRFSASPTGPENRGRKTSRAPPHPIVYADDAVDIKAHKWFRNVPFDHLHQISPPWVPGISNLTDTRYFEEDEPVSDWSESVNECDSESELQGDIFDDGTAQHYERQRKVAGRNAELKTMPRQLRSGLLQFVNSPYTSQRLKQMDHEIEAYVKNETIQQNIKTFIRKHGRKERKRPRDRLLRDRRCKNDVLRIRRQVAFLGYTYLRK